MDCSRKRAPTPVNDVDPPSGRPSSCSVSVHHAQHHCFNQSVIVHSAYVQISRAPKRSKFCKFLDLENFRSIWLLTLSLEVQRENTPYSSSEPNESGIVKKAKWGKKLKHVLKFYIGGTHHVISRMRNDDLAPGNRMVTWPQTSRDLEWSTS